MKRKAVGLLLSLILMVSGCSYSQNQKELPKIDEAKVERVQFRAAGGTKTKELNNKIVYQGLIKLYNQAEVHPDQSFETTPENELIIILQNGERFIIMDGDGPQALVILPNDSRVVVKGQIGEYIEKLNTN